MKQRTEMGWAIVGRSGLYTFANFSRTRIAAIAVHVHFLTRRNELQPSMYAFGKLDDLQRERWDRCQKNGDSAVKVAVTYAVPSR